MSIDTASPREVQRALSAELLAALRHQAQTQTDFLERLAGQVVNNVLEVFSGVFDTTGVLVRDYGVAAGCAVVANMAAGVAATTGPIATVGADPAAGVEVLVTVPPGETWALQAFDFTLVTSAVVATRRVSIIIDDGANIVWHGVVSTDQAAAQTVEYAGGAGVAETAAVRTGVLNFALPAITLGPGWRIRTVTALIDAGDNYGPPKVAYIRSTAAAGGAAVTVSSAGPGSSTPSGTGTTLVPAGQTRTVALASHQLTLYGTPGAAVMFTTYTAGPRPVMGT